MRTALNMLIAMGLVAIPASGVQLEVSGDPPPETNLLENPSMEKGAGGEPAHWSFDTAEPDNFTTAWAEQEGVDGSRALYVRAHDDVMSGYWTQVVDTPPGVYTFSGLYRTTGGRLLMYAHGENTEVKPAFAVDARTYHGSAVASFLVPVFIPSEALTGPDPDTYYPFSVQVDVRQRIEQLKLSMGIYFTPGEAWFDEVSFRPATMNMTVQVRGEGEQIARLTVFEADQVEPVYRSDRDPDFADAEALPDPFEITLEDLPSGGDYLIVAKTVDDTLHRVHFPEEVE